MSNTALDHPLVRDYLRQLDAALAQLPSGQARELREQITAHLEDELSSGTSGNQVADALLRLGLPSEVVAEARRSAAPVASSRDVARWLGSRFKRLTWRFWVAISVLILAGGILVWFQVSFTSAALQFGGEDGWWYPKDSAHAVQTFADEAQQTTVPERWDQKQGFYVDVENDSRWTETVLGYASDLWTGPGSFYQHLGVSVEPDVHDWPGIATSDHYGLPVSIPPGQTRYLRIMWTSTMCNQQGGAEGFDQLQLRVRVGWITRTEVVQLDQGWYVSGTKQSTCSGSAAG